MIGEGNGCDPVFIRNDIFFRLDLLLQTSSQIGVEFERKGIAASSVEKNAEEAFILFDVAEDVRERFNCFLSELRFRSIGQSRFRDGFPSVLKFLDQRIDIFLQ